MQQLGKNANKIYNYLQDVNEATRDKIIEQTGLALSDYFIAKKELIESKKAEGIKGPRGGLRLRSTDEPKKDTQQTHEKVTSLRDKESRTSSLSPKASELYKMIPEDGRFVTNQSLRFRLRPKAISYDDYYKYRTELLAKGLIILGTGRGGTVGRDLGEPAEEHKQEEVKRPKEDYTLYEQITNWLANDENNNIKPTGRVFAAVTATPSGYKQRSGRWSRPDVMLVAFNSYPRLTQKTDMTVKSYEVKKYEKYLMKDPAIVFEAASHQKGAHYSYLVVGLLGDSAKQIHGDTEGAPEDLVPLLERFGVGFAWFYKPENMDTYDMNIVMDAERQNPDPPDENEMVNNLYNKLSESEKSNFDKWARG
jgi:hypothetical protein